MARSWRRCGIMLPLSVLLALPGVGWGQIKANDSSGEGNRTAAGRPRARPTDGPSDEQVVFFPTSGYRSAAGDAWEVPIHGWVFEPEEDSLVRTAALGVFRSFFGREWSDAEAERFRSRARMFLVDNERGKSIRVRIGDREHPVGVSGANGHFHATLQLGEVESPATAGPGPEWLPYLAITTSGDDRGFAGAVQLLAPEGVSVISDLDDTIKNSQVGELRELLSNTFLRPFQPVPGMADAYQTWAEAARAFHYVSASPWQLYPVVDEFLREQRFPRGSVHMKLVRWKDSSAANLFAPSAEGKRVAIEELLGTYPRRRFLLVGDSGEQDPELYGELARTHPEQVSGIFIRDVGNGADAERLGAAFRGLPADRWSVFRDGRDLLAAGPPFGGE